MTKEQIIDKHAQNLKSWVGTSLAKEECIGLIKNVVDEALILSGVAGQSEQLKPKPQICYKSNELCKYDCSGLCKESC